MMDCKSPSPKLCNISRACDHRTKEIILLTCPATLLIRYLNKNMNNLIMLEPQSSSMNLYVINFV
jgi:hypothetical protein